jgi:hypothetical protein
MALSGSVSVILTSAFGGFILGVGMVLSGSVSVILTSPFGGFLLGVGMALSGSVSVASDKVYLLLAHGWWFSPGTPSSSTTKTGRHDIAEILLKVALKHPKSFKYNLGLIMIVLSILYFHVMVTIL